MSKRHPRAGNSSFHKCRSLFPARHFARRTLLIRKATISSPTLFGSLTSPSDPFAFRWNDFGLVHRPPVSYLLAMQSLLASRRPGVSQATTPRSGLVQPAVAADRAGPRDSRVHLAPARPLNVGPLGKVGETRACRWLALKANCYSRRRSPPLFFPTALNFPQTVDHPRPQRVRQQVHWRRGLSEVDSDYDNGLLL